MTQETNYFTPISNPNYATGFTTLCYDCHDNHSATVVDNDPPDASFSSSRLPQDVAFDDNMKTTVPRENGVATDNKPGYYENIPSKTTYPGTSTYISGHYVKNNPGGGTISQWDKLPCADCHNPHATATQAFMRSSLGGKSLLANRKASTRMAYDLTTRSDTESRDFCIFCHGTSDQNNAFNTAVLFSDINPLYGGNVIAKPTTAISAHDSSDTTTACTSCHNHNSISISCSDCHGFPPLQTYAQAGNKWFDKTVPALRDVENYAGGAGAHQRHKDALGDTIFKCEICHGPGGGSGSWHNQGGGTFPATTLAGGVNVNIMGQDSYWKPAGYPGVAPIPAYVGGVNGPVSGDAGWTVLSKMAGAGTQRCAGVACHGNPLIGDTVQLNWTDDLVDEATGNPVGDGLTICKWCHDATPATINGGTTYAPNVMGNNLATAAGFGAEVNGHGVGLAGAVKARYDKDLVNDGLGTVGGGAAKNCTVCHDATYTTTTPATPTRTHFGAGSDPRDIKRLRDTINTVSIDNSAIFPTGPDQACSACHQNGVNTVADGLDVSYHGIPPQPPPSGGYVPSEGAAADPPFTRACRQCHEVHGSNWNGTGRNLFMAGKWIDVNGDRIPNAGDGAYVDSNATTSLAAITPGGGPGNDNPVIFTSTTSTDSFDESDTVGTQDTDDICATCHKTTTRGGDHSGTTGFTEDMRGQNCMSCHDHDYDNNRLTEDAFMPVDCNGCHGNSSTDTVPRPPAILGQYWPDGLVAPGVNATMAYADDKPGSHLRHVEAIAQELYSETADGVVTNTGKGLGRVKQIVICSFCHQNPGSAGHHINGTNDGPTGQSPALQVNVRSGAAGDIFKTFLDGAGAYGDDTHNVAAYNYNNRICTNVDCHYEASYGTPTYGGTAPNIGWDIADTAGNEPDCRTCHYYRDAASGSGPTGTAVWTPLTPQLPNAHQAHVGGIVPPGVSQSRSYPCFWCHPIPGATRHTNGDIDLSTAGNLTLSKETPPDNTDELMTPSSSAVKYGVGPLLANTICADMYCHGADFGAVAGTETLTQGTNVAPTWNNHLTGTCGTCHDVSTDAAAAYGGQTFAEGQHRLHISSIPGPYGPAATHNDCTFCHGVVNVTPPVVAGTCGATAGLCHPNLGLSGFLDPEAAGYASFPSRSHVEGNFAIDFENTNRVFNSLADYVAAPMSTLAGLGTAWNVGTDICNRCHSTATVGGTIGATLAKVNWNTVAYRFPDCLSCHNAGTPAWSTPVRNGVQAPAKDAYFTTRGHGNTGTYPWGPNRSGANLTCTDCHASTSAHINGTLGSTDRLATAGNGLCDGCHGTAGSATKVSTHGNRSTTMSYTAQRAVFELNCAECHDVHGTGPSNIFMINAVNPDGPLVAPRYYNGVSNTATFLFQPAATVAFTANTLGSDFASTSANANKICQTCHTATGGVYQHNSPTTGHGISQCTECHKHDFDGNYDATASQDGFMPSGCVGCHGNPPNAGCDNTPGTADDAPNVMGDGTNATGTGSPTPKPFDDGTYGYNVNGHGANGSRIPILTPNKDCGDCHDLGSPSPNKHNDCDGAENVDQRVNTRFYFGKAADTRNANTSHLVSGFLAGAANPSAKQIGFDDYCFNTCHPAWQIDMRHSFTGGNIDLASKIMEYNTTNTVTDDPKQNRGADNIWTPWTIDDLTNVAGVEANPPTVRYNGVCVSCHNPHGTSTLQKTRGTNKMVIRNWQDTEMPAYCQSNCHKTP